MKNKKKRLTPKQKEKKRAELMERAGQYFSRQPSQQVQRKRVNAVKRLQREAASKKIGSLSFHETDAALEEMIANQEY